MNGTLTEIFATVVTVGAIATATVFPLSKKSPTSSARVVTLTGVGATGVWTSEEVTGANYWVRPFSPARLVFRVGEEVLLRLRSADVLHTFYSPALGVGPVEVHPGYVEEVRVVPRHEGVLEYYCTTVCGDPHFGMRGEIVVVRDGAANVPPHREQGQAYWEEKAPPVGASLALRGQWLFKRHGCFNCHGEGGKGGVVNFNYITNTIPAVKMLARTMALREKDDAKEIVGLLERGVPLTKGGLKMSNANVVVAKYDSIRDVIRKGNPPGKKDPKGPNPPLEMPAWGQRLSERDIDAVISYLVTLYPWEEEEQKEKEKEKKEKKEEKDETEEKEEEPE
ncbi:MAG: c-type cytochrome [Deltaproteobacteria bacterium]|nr:c-type cytochrome [Deltaproteobacteria bacterium]